MIQTLPDARPSFPAACARLHQDAIAQVLQAGQWPPPAPHTRGSAPPSFPFQVTPAPHARPCSPCEPGAARQHVWATRQVLSTRDPVCSSRDDPVRPIAVPVPAMTRLVESGCVCEGLRVVFRRVLSPCPSMPPPAGPQSPVPVSLRGHCASPSVGPPAPCVSFGGVCLETSEPMSTTTGCVLKHGCGCTAACEWRAHMALTLDAAYPVSLAARAPLCRQLSSSQRPSPFLCLSSLQQRAHALGAPALPCPVCSHSCFPLRVPSSLPSPPPCASVESP